MTGTEVREDETHPLEDELLRGEELQIDVEVLIDVPVPEDDPDHQLIDVRVLQERIAIDATALAAAALIQIRTID